MTLDSFTFFTFTELLVGIEGTYTRPKDYLLMNKKALPVRSLRADQG